MDAKKRANTDAKESASAGAGNSATLILGKEIARDFRREVKSRVSELFQAGRRPPGLAIVLVGEDPASQIYIRLKSRACKQVGVHYFDHCLDANTSGEELLALVDRLNHDPEIDGILVQFPLPPALQEFELRVMATIDPMKDVDGLHAENVGMLQLGRPRFIPCTPAGVLAMLDRAKVPLEGARAVVVGRSAMVGRPLATLLSQRNATVTLCHSCTRNLQEEVARADVLVAAVGSPHLIEGDWIKEGATVIDIGINRLDGDLVGDVQFSVASTRAAYISPVPGGVGPMTIAMLMHNCLQARLLHAD